MLFSPAAETQMKAWPVGWSGPRLSGQHDRGGFVLAHRRHHRRGGAAAGGGHGLVAALAARQAVDALAGHGLSGRGQILHAADDVEVQGSDDADAHGPT
jgi:hypothetical protein